MKLNRRGLFGLLVGAWLAPAAALAKEAEEIDPIRLSVFEGDPGYPSWQRLVGQCKNVRVYVDGAERQEVVRVDMARGEVHWLDTHPAYPEASTPWVVRKKRYGRDRVRLEIFSV